MGSAEVPRTTEGLFPAVGMHSLGEVARVDLQAQWLLEEDESMMMVDSHEDDWGRLFDVRASGTVRRTNPATLVPGLFLRSFTVFHSVRKAKVLPTIGPDVFKLFPEQISC